MLTMMEYKQHTTVSQHLVTNELTSLELIMDSQELSWLPMRCPQIPNPSIDNPAWIQTDINKTIVFKSLSLGQSPRSKHPKVGHATSASSFSSTKKVQGPRDKYSVKQTPDEGRVGRNGMFLV